MMNTTDLGICPVCSKEKETWTHLLTCCHEDSIAIKSLVLAKFSALLIKCKTAPVIRSVLRYKLAQFLNVDHNTVPIIPGDLIGTTLGLGIEQQANIGWVNFLKGRVSKKFGDAQQIFYNIVHPNGTYTRDQWMGKMITGVWQIFYDIWQ